MAVVELVTEAVGWAVVAEGLVATVMEEAADSVRLEAEVDMVAAGES